MRYGVVIALIGLLFALGTSRAPSATHASTTTPPCAATSCVFLPLVHSIPTDAKVVHTYGYWQLRFLWFAVVVQNVSAHPLCELGIEVISPNETTAGWFTEKISITELVLYPGQNLHPAVLTTPERYPEMRALVSRAAPCANAAPYRPLTVEAVAIEDHSDRNCLLAMTGTIRNPHAVPIAQSTVYLAYPGAQEREWSETEIPVLAPGATRSYQVNYSRVGPCPNEPGFPDVRAWGVVEQ
jgi:hypothetical protein